MGNQGGNLPANLLADARFPRDNYPSKRVGSRDEVTPGITGGHVGSTGTNAGFLL